MSKVFSSSPILQSDAIKMLITDCDTGQTAIGPYLFDTRALYLAIGGHYMSVQRTKMHKAGKLTAERDLASREAANVREMNLIDGIFAPFSRMFDEGEE